MPTNSLVSRTDVSPLIPEDTVREIFQGITTRSAVMSLARRLPNMSRTQQRLPVLSSLPTAYFVNGDTGLKQTTNVAWANKYINAEELAVIVPIPEAVLDDSDYDIWAEIRPLVEEALGIAFDNAVLFGTNAPASWPDEILTAAIAAGNRVTLGTGADLYDDISGESGVIAKIEADGFMASGHIAAMTLRGKLRGLRSSTGELIFTTSMQAAGQYNLDGSSILFPTSGIMDPAVALLISGLWSQMVYSIRQDLTWKLLDQAVIQDNAGNIIYNLAQQDMVALRVVMRLGWQLPNPVNRMQATEASRYPFAVLTP
jgi:HK97 family phage major capsid protein